MHKRYLKNRRYVDIQRDQFLKDDQLLEYSHFQNKDSIERVAQEKLQEMSQIDQRKNINKTEEDICGWSILTPIKENYQSFSQCQIQKKIKKRTSLSEKKNTQNSKTIPITQKQQIQKNQQSKQQTLPISQTVNMMSSFKPNHTEEYANRLKDIIKMVQYQNNKLFKGVQKMKELTLQNPKEQKFNFRRKRKSITRHNIENRQPFSLQKQYSKFIAVRSSSFSNKVEPIKKSIKEKPIFSYVNTNPFLRMNMYINTTIVHNN